MDTGKKWRFEKKRETSRWVHQNWSIDFSFTAMHWSGKSNVSRIMKYLSHSIHFNSRNTLFRAKQSRPYMSIFWFGKKWFPIWIMNSDALTIRNTHIYSADETNEYPIFHSQYQKPISDFKTIHFFTNYQTKISLHVKIIDVKFVIIFHIVSEQFCIRSKEWVYFFTPNRNIYEKKEKKTYFTLAHCYLQKSYRTKHLFHLQIFVVRKSIEKFPRNRTTSNKNQPGKKRTKRSPPKFIARAQKRLPSRNAPDNPICTSNRNRRHPFLLACQKFLPPTRTSDRRSRCRLSIGY